VSRQSSAATTPADRFVINRFATALVELMLVRVGGSHRVATQTDLSPLGVRCDSPSGFTQTRRFNSEITSDGWSCHVSL
jgi:hypothetical protein